MIFIYFGATDAKLVLSVNRKVDALRQYKSPIRRLVTPVTFCTPKTNWVLPFVHPLKLLLINASPMFASPSGSKLFRVLRQCKIIHFI